MANKFFGAISHLGGADGDLDAISKDIISDGDGAFVVDAVNNTADIYTCVAADTTAEDSAKFTVIIPDDEAAAPAAGMRWFKVNPRGWNGTDAIDFITDLARRVGTPDAANLCGMDADGDPTDSGLVVAQTPQLNTAQEWAAQQNFNEDSVTSSGNAVAWDWDTDQCTLHTLTENTTISAPTNANVGSVAYLRVVQAAGLYTLAWNAAFDWGRQDTPEAPLASGDTVLFGFYYDGTNYLATEIVRKEA
jgi:hypothetical protein